MKIYFAGSIKGGRENVKVFAEIVDHLKTKGQVLTEHVADPNLSNKGETDKTPQFIHDRDVNWLDESDVVVAEVSKPSLGVGYELGRAAVMDKKILCLFNGEEIALSNMIKGMPGVKIEYYNNIEAAKKFIDDFLSI